MTRQQQDFSTQNKIDQNKNKERRWWHSVRLFVRGHIRETTNAKRQSKLHESTFNYWVHCIGMQCIWIPRRPSLPQNNTTHHTQPPSLWFAKLYNEGVGGVELIQHTTPSRTPYIHPNKRMKNVWRPREQHNICNSTSIINNFKEWHSATTISL